MTEFTQTQRVIAAVREARSEWLDDDRAKSQTHETAQEAKAENDAAGDAIAPVEVRLRRLKAMLDEGLIGEADYEAKKRELLENL